ncbi:MAG: ATP-binding protein, partial [Synergistaceae bacterium]|nr:ATP-binding protein [Synergistaceae bacterium]
MEKALIVQKFERDFFERTYPSVVHDYSVAFSEIVANAWDAGATRVDITLPEMRNEDIIIKDNGSGMTDDEFNNRWMVIAYNRVAHQGEYIEYPTERGKVRRMAYGRNGAGRHAMLCFDNFYTVETCKSGKRNTYDVSVLNDGTSALSVVDHKISDCEASGTTLFVKAVKSLPGIDELKNMLSYKFLFDPEFQIYINSELLDYQKHTNMVQSEFLSVDHNTMSVSIYETPEGGKNTASTGITFWVGNRLVGNPSWT